MTLLEIISEFIEKRYKWLLALAVLLAAFLRFAWLGSTTLVNHEAQNALQAFEIIRDPSSVVIGGQPGYVGLTSFLFFLFSGSDFFARFWPALFGTCLVLVPGLFRKRLDDVTVLLLAFLIAIEPGLVALSRTADGTMIAITSLALAVGFLLKRKAILTGIFLGLALAGSERFWPLIIAVYVAGLLAYGPALKTKKLDEGSKGKDGINLFRLILSVAVTILLVTTIFLSVPKGISGIGTSLSFFVKSWGRGADLKIGSFLLILLAAQSPVLIFGVWGMIRGLLEKSSLSRFLGIWWGIGLLLGLLSSTRDVWTIVLINLPGYILTALQLKHLLKKILFESKIVVLIETVATVSLFVFSMLNLLNMINFTPSDPVMFRNRLIGILLPLALWVAFTMLLAWGWDVPSTKSGLMLGIALLFGALLVGSGVKATGLGSRPANELFASGSYISGEKDLLTAVTDISRWNSGQATRIDIDLVGLDSPSLSWLLRNFEKVTADSVFPTDETPSILISGMDSMLQSSALYRGQSIIWSTGIDYSAMTWIDWLKWQFNRLLPQKNETIILWVRNDLFKDTASQLP